MAQEQIEKARKALSSDNPGVVIFGLRTLAKEGKLTDLQTLMACIASTNSKIKEAAVEATCTLIKENLILHFNELDVSMRDRLGTLMQTLDPSVLDEISKDLYSEDDDRRLRAVQILGHMGKNPEIRKILAKLVQDRNVKIRATAVNLMGKVIGQQDHEILLSLLNDGDKRVRANTIEALESLGNKRMVPVLLRFRRDTSNRIRGNVLKALYKLGFTDIEQDLLDMIQSQDNLMKASALWVVSQIKAAAPSVIDGCGFNLLNSDEMVYRNAHKAAEALDAPRAKGYLRYLADFMPPAAAVAAPRTPSPATPATAQSSTNLPK
jgi:HEAT repeat protein